MGFLFDQDFVPPDAPDDAGPDPDVAIAGLPAPLPEEPPAVEPAPPPPAEPGEPPLPPPPPAGGGPPERPGWHGAAGNPHRRFLIPGYGEIVHSAARETFGAHCKCDHGLCRTNRTRKANDARPMQGRPLVFWAAWLRAGLDEADFEAHQRLSRREGRWALEVSLAARQDARNWLRAMPGSGWLFELERQRRGDEPEEPIELVY